MANNENDLTNLLGHVIEDVQEEGLAGAGKKLLGGLFGNALAGFLGDDAENEESAEAGSRSRRNEDDEDDEDAVESPDNDDDKVVNTAGGNYADSQRGRGQDHDVDDDIDGDEDDTSDAQNG